MAIAALGDTSWHSAAHKQVREDAEWLSALLESRGLTRAPRSAVHFALWKTRDPCRLAGEFESQAIVVRPLGGAHGLVPGAVRITAPPKDARDRFERAVYRAGR